MALERAQLNRLLDLVTPVYLFLALGVISVVVMIIGTCQMLAVDGPLPPPRPPPPKPEASTVLSYRYKEGFFKSLLQEDAQRVKLADFDYARMKRPNRYFAEFTGKQLLRAGAKLETRHLLLEALKKKIWVGQRGQGFRSDHMLLAITNKTDRYLAYRVITEPVGTCQSNKGTISHNALALRPKERLQRTECLIRTGGALRVLEVAVMEIPPLGYYYVSRLDPVQIRLPQRTAEGHEIPNKLTPCKILPWREIQNGMRRGEVYWRDVIDFYARHNCDEYSYFVAYRHDAKGPGRLPAAPTQD
jgi:hypothetical protein